MFYDCSGTAVSVEPSSIIESQVNPSIVSSAGSGTLQLPMMSMAMRRRNSIRVLESFVKANSKFASNCAVDSGHPATTLSSGITSMNHRNSMVTLPSHLLSLPSLAHMAVEGDETELDETPHRQRSRTEEKVSITQMVKSDYYK